MRESSARGAWRVELLVRGAGGGACREDSAEKALAMGPLALPQGPCLEGVWAGLQSGRAGEAVAR